MFILDFIRLGKFNHSLNIAKELYLTWLRTTCVLCVGGQVGICKKRRKKVTTHPPQLPFPAEEFEIVHHLSDINIEYNPTAALTLPLFVDHLTLLYVNEPKIHV